MKVDILVQHTTEMSTQPKTQTCVQPENTTSCTSIYISSSTCIAYYSVQTTCMYVSTYEKLKSLDLYIYIYIYICICINYI